MSRFLATLFWSMPALVALPPPATAFAQEAYGPQEEYEGDEDTPNPLDDSKPCETQAQEDGVILVCRELTDSEQYLSPLPQKTQSDRVIIPGLTDPPCWVSNPGGGLCIRVGYAPESVLIIDVTAFPEALSEEETTLIHKADAAADRDQPATGTRVAIDISEDEASP